MIFGGSALLVAGIALGVANDALASIPDSGGTIHGCYQSPPPAHGANLQVIDTGNGGSCGGGMVSLTWNQTGPQGPAGATGPQGPQGAAGATGSQGPAGPSTAGAGGLSVTVVYGSAGSNYQAFAECPTSLPYVLGGGGEDATGDFLFSSKPWDFTTNSTLIGAENSSDRYGWEVQFYNGSPIYAEAICSA